MDTAGGEAPDFIQYEYLGTGSKLKLKVLEYCMFK